MSTPQHKIKRKLADFDIEEHEKSEAQDGYDNLVRIPKPATPGNLLRDAVGIRRDAEDLPRDPFAFRDRLRGRLEAYQGRGPDLNEPAYTASMNRNSVLPGRARFDLQLAQEAVENRARFDKPKARRPKVRYPSPRKFKGK